MLVSVDNVCRMHGTGMICSWKRCIGNLKNLNVDI